MRIPFACFLVAVKWEASHDGMEPLTETATIAATTRLDGSLGLPGGKVNVGESPEDCVRRESSEEGWLLPVSARLTLDRAEDVGGKLVHWYRSNVFPSLMVNWKEESRGISPVETSPMWLVQKSPGMCNEFLLLGIK